MRGTRRAHVAFVAIGLLLATSGCDSVTSLLGATPTPTPPPVTITLKQIGTVKSHEGFPLLMGNDDVRLLVVVDDGKAPVPISLFLPPQEASAFQVTPGVPTRVGQVVFRTSSVGDYLNLKVIAWEEDDLGWLVPISQIVLPLLVGPTVAGVGDLFSTGMLEEALGGGNDPVGYFEGSWSSEDDWGAGRYLGVGSQDLQLWIDIEVEGYPMPTFSGTTSNATPTTTPHATATSASTSEPTVSPSPRADLAELIPSPTSTPTAIPAGAGVVLQLDQVTINQHCDPFGNSEVYLILGLGDGSMMHWRRLPSEGWYSIPCGGTIAQPVSIEFRPVPSTLQIYVGVWEQDSHVCGPLFAEAVQSPYPGTVDDFTQHLRILEDCGEDLVGHGSTTLTSEDKFGRFEVTLDGADVVYKLVES